MIDVVSNGVVCTGIVVAPTLVMTSQHCLTNNGAGEEGATTNDISGCTLGTNPLSASQVKILFGTTAATAIQASRIIFDVDNTDCTKDLAFVVLSHPATLLSPYPILLDGPATAQDPVTSIGWGETGNDDAGYKFPATRQQYSGTILLTNGGVATTPDGSTVMVPSGYIASSVLACDGDSGSALIDTEVKALVGSANAILSTKTITLGSDQQGDCADSVLVSAPYSRNVHFIEEAFQSVGLMPWRWGQTSPPADVGGACQKDNQCNSNYCVFLGAGTSGYCSHPCTEASDCENGTTCISTGEASQTTDDGGGTQNVCLPPLPVGSTRGCAIGGAPRVSAASSSAIIVGLALGWRRKKRRDARGAVQA